MCEAQGIDPGGGCGARPGSDPSPKLADLLRASAGSASGPDCPSVRSLSGQLRGGHRTHFTEQKSESGTVRGLACGHTAEHGLDSMRSGAAPSDPTRPSRAEPRAHPLPPSAGPGPRFLGLQPSLHKGGLEAPLAAGLTQPWSWTQPCPWRRLRVGDPWGCLPGALPLCQERPPSSDGGQRRQEKGRPLPGSRACPCPWANQGRDCRGRTTSPCPCAGSCGLTVPGPAPPAAGWWPGSAPQSYPWRAQNCVLGSPQGSGQRAQVPGRAAGT